MSKADTSRKHLADEMSAIMDKLHELECGIRRLKDEHEDTERDLTRCILQQSDAPYLLKPDYKMIRSYIRSA